jgi:hypothetical protein
MAYLTLNEGALSETSAQEGGIAKKQDPGAFRENDSGKEETEP